jgi:hypothetical protein
MIRKFNKFQPKNGTKSMLSDCKFGKGANNYHSNRDVRQT